MTTLLLANCTRRDRRLSLIGKRGALLAILLAAGLSACSQSDQEHAGADSVSTPVATNAMTQPAPTSVSTAPADNACDLLTDADVRRIFPTASSGKRNTDSLEYGLDRCAWQTPGGQIGVEVSKVTADAFAGELRAELQGAVDPRIEGALDQIQFHPVDGIGDHAIAVMEKADAQRGVLTDMALLAIQRRQRMAVLMIHESSVSAPLPDLEALKELGRSLAPRL